MSTSEAIFLIVGGVGFVFLLASFLLGEVGSDSNVETTSVDADASHADIGNDSATDPSWFSTQIIAAALVGFGGFGILALQFRLPVLLAWPMAVVGFFAIAAITHQFVIKPLARQQYNSQLSRQSYVGMRGHVILPIPSDGFGIVRFRDRNNAIVEERAQSTGEILSRDIPVMVIDITPDGVVVEPDNLHTTTGG